MDLIYIYHSGFAIETPECILIIDYYEDSIDKDRGVVHERLLREKKRMYVLSTHSHHDHYNPDILQWRDLKKDITYIFSKDIEPLISKVPENVTFIDKDGIFTDELLTVKAFGSTDLGVSFKIELGGKVIFHAGDLNNWHWNEESTVDEIKEAESFYERELNHVAKFTKYIDLAMFPVDPRLGKDYMLGAEQFIDKIPTKLFVPMHFGLSYDRAKGISSFANRHGVKTFVPECRGDVLKDWDILLEQK